jgi:azurin
MTSLQLAGTLTLLMAGKLAYAGPCQLTIEANDMMQYNIRELSVPASCTDIEVTLKHSGKLQAKVMGHDWVLAKRSDVPGIVNAGMAAGLAHGFLAANDKRIIAATAVVGGGESAMVRFSSGVLEEGVSYAFFCTAPGHATVMRGSFVFGDMKRVAKAGK